MSVAPSSRRLLNPALIDSRMDNYCEVAVLGECLPISSFVTIVMTCSRGLLAMLAYDHLLTFAGEIHFVWRRKFSGATIIFSLNRYVNLFGKVLLVMSTMWWPAQTTQVRYVSMSYSPLL